MHDVGDCEAAAGFQNTKGFAQHLTLVGRKIDHAIGDDDVDRSRRKRNVLDLTLEELDIGDACLPLIVARELEHLVRHVEAVRLSGRANSARREEHIEAAAGAEIEDDLAGVEVGEHRRIATPEGCIRC